MAFARGEDLAEQVPAAAGGGVDVVLDPLGTTMLQLDLAVAAPGRRVVLFGNAAGGTPGLLPPAGLIAGNVAVGGFSINRLSAAAPHRVAAALRRVLDLIAAGRLHTAVTEVSSPADVPAIHQLLPEGRGTGKYVARLQPAKPTPSADASSV